jgi:hypothetical protein
MTEEIQELIKKFEQDHEIYVDATNAQTYWIMHARIPKNEKVDTHHLHRGKKYVSGPNEDGSVLVIPDPEISNAYEVESWGKMESFDDFVKTGLDRVLADKEQADKGMEGGCGTSCG